MSRDTRQVDADSGGVIEARQPDNGGFDTGGYTDTRGENIDVRYIVKAIIVPLSKSKHLKDPLSVTKNQHFQSFGTVKRIRIRKSENLNI